MIRNLKALGLALVAVLAMGAVVASSASALEFSAEKYPVTVHGSSAAGVEKFTTEAGTVECAGSFHGTQTLAEHEEKNMEITNEKGEKEKVAGRTIRVTPTYTSCKAFGFLSATVNASKCHYVFHLTEKTAIDVFHAHVTVECTEGGVITIVASTCEATVGSQGPLGSVEITNDTAATPKKDVTVLPNVKGIAYTVTKDGIGCPFGGTGAKTGGTYTASAATTITGQNPSKAEEKIGIEVK